MIVIFIVNVFLGSIIMCVFVFGSGVIGVSSVYYLVCVGYEVIVVDCEVGLVLEMSFVNVG